MSGSSEFSPTRVRPHSPGRPQQIRQTSFSKRHASFDTPREVPGIPERCFPERNLLTNDDRSLSTYIQNLPEVASSKAPKITKTSSGDNYISSFPNTIYSIQKNTPDSSKNANVEARNKCSDTVAPSRINNTPYTVSKDPMRAEEFSGIYQRNICSPIPLRPSSTNSLPHLNQIPHSLLTSSATSQNHTDISDGTDFRSESGSVSDSRALSELPTLTASLFISTPSKFSEGKKPSTSCWDPSSPDFVLSNSSNLSIADTQVSSKSSFSRGSNASSTSQSSLFSGMNSSLSSMPAPSPPTILTPPPAPLDGKDGDQKSKMVAPYEPFLSRNPASNECHIVIDSMPTEYIMTARLPGYQRESITVTARRRRILHILADSWDVGGGHFERRISFGYDADVNRVRAEFDGEHLRVIVPRKLNPW